MSWDIGISVSGYQLEGCSWNYTHNCNQMMRGANFNWVYTLDGQLVADTVDNFKMMLANLKADPERFRALNPVNGWGSYDSLVELWETEILPTVIDVAEKIPNATWWESS